MQPIRLMVTPGRACLSGLSEVTRPMALSSALWRTTQVLSTMTCASSITGVAW